MKPSIRADEVKGMVMVGMVTMRGMKEWYRSMVEGFGAPGASNPALKGRAHSRGWSRLGW